ncbi:MAG: NAD-binding protein [Anaerolineales bacterium]
MKVIIIGCGRVGEQLARLLVEDNHQVAVIDYDPSALARLGPNFKGQRITGVGFDRDILLQAGIEQADAFAAASSSDNVNIVAARIAHNIFHVPRVVARLFDPRRAEIYRRLGMLTISSTTWGAERLRELLTSAEFDPIISFGSGEVSLVNIDIPSHLVGRMVKDLTVSSEISIVTITRNGAAFIPTLGSQFREGDIVQVAILASALERFKSLLGLEEGG